jgi:hypothetical protein
MSPTSRRPHAITSFAVVDGVEVRYPGLGG